MLILLGFLKQQQLFKDFVEPLEGPKTQSSTSWKIVVELKKKIYLKIQILFILHLLEIANNPELGFLRQKVAIQLKKIGPLFLTTLVLYAT